MKHSTKSRSHKSYPDARQRERRFVILALTLGAILALIVGLMIYLMSGGSRL
jgi:predicted nucleic acid-binding Zn ribbon protein